MSQDRGGRKQLPREQSLPLWECKTVYLHDHSGKKKRLQHLQLRTGFAADGGWGQHDATHQDYTVVYSLTEHHTKRIRWLCLERKCTGILFPTVIIMSESYESSHQR